MATPPWLREGRPFAVARDGAECKVIVLPRKALPAEFPGDRDARAHPSVVCTTRDRQWANFIARALNDEYEDLTQDTEETDEVHS